VTSEQHAGLGTPEAGVDMVLPASMNRIGQRLRTAREARRMSLRELARRTNVSPSFVSQVERGKTSPSVGTLYSLVTELGLSLDELMLEDPAVVPVPDQPDAATEVRSGEPPPVSAALAGVAPFAWNPQDVTWPRIRRPVQYGTGRPVIKLSGVTWERLTHDEDPFVDFLSVTYQPGTSSCPEDDMVRHGGREYGHVISGRIDIQIGFEMYRLSTGDSVHFDAMTPHRLSNPYDQPCVAVWVLVGRSGDDRGSESPDPDSKHLPGLL
jgi:transcriptional regulator with XRE-family HTH domain/quercetin dioxygenase-like cupin family protein